MRQPTIRQRKLNLLYGNWYEHVCRLRARGLSVNRIADLISSEASISIHQTTLSLWLHEVERGERLTTYEQAA